MILNIAESLALSKPNLFEIVEVETKEVQASEVSNKVMKKNAKFK